MQQAKQTQFIAQVIAIFESFGLTQMGWSFKFDRAKRRAGCCFYNTKTVSLSYYLVEQNNFIVTDNVKNILLHEIAHALVGPNHGHDDIWRKKALEIGCDGMRCHSMKFAMAAFVYSCECGKCQLNRHRRLTRDLICRECKSLLVLN